LVSEADRGAMDQSLASARQRAEAARALWVNGQPLEALPLAARALLETLELAERLVPPGEGSDGNALARLVPASIQRDVEGAAGQARAVLEGETASDAALAYRRWMRSRLVVDRAIAPAVMTRRRATAERIRRLLAVAAFLLVAVAGTRALLERPTELRAEASDVFDRNALFGPENVLDGDPDTEWLLPDGATGWVEVRLPEPRGVTRVVLTNCDNPGFFDRASRGYRVELYGSADQLVQAIDGEFPRLEQDPDTVSHALEAGEVARVRFVVRGHHGAGGGLADLEIE
jgi:hypothetical protein